MHFIDKRCHRLGRGVLVDAVAEVEDVPWADAEVIQHAPRLPAHRRLAPEQHHRIEVALSNACVRACPEHATRLVSSTTGLVDQDHSIGPDACEAACPIEAIQPGFRAENCGIDFPFGTPAVATNTPGIFLAGELG